MWNAYHMLSVLKKTGIHMHQTPETLRGVENVIVPSDVVMKNHFFFDFLSTLLLDCLYNPLGKGGTYPTWPVLEMCALQISFSPPRGMW